MSDSLVKDWLERGYREFKDGRYEQARECFAKAAAQAPHSAEAHAWLAAVYGRQIQVAWSLTEKIDLLSLLESEIDIALELDPALPLARRMNGARLLNTPDMLGGDPALAVDEFRYCIDHGMDEAEVWVSLAECYLKTDEPKQADKALQEALARDPHHEKAVELIRQMKAAGGGH